MILNDAQLLQCGAELFPEHWDEMDLDVQIQPASVDLRLGHTFSRYCSFSPPLPGHAIDPLTDHTRRLMENVTVSEGERYLVNPGHENFVLATTEEIVQLPDNLVARVEGRSSLGRLGLRVHSTAGYVDPGFHGRITLEIDVVGCYPIWLTPGMRVCQLSFSRMEGPAARPYGALGRNSKYQGQARVQHSLSWKDPEGE